LAIDKDRDGAIIPKIHFPVMSKTWHFEKKNIFKMPLSLFKIVDTLSNITIQKGKAMFKKLIGVGLIIGAFVVEAMWLAATFGTVIVGVVLLVFAPAILFLPFNVLFAMGVAFLTYEDEKYSEYNNSEYGSHENDEPSYNDSKTEMQEYYDVLGCSSNDDFSLIKKAYRELSKKFHPDSIAGKGLDDEFMHYATRKMKEINEAYMKIKAARFAT